jgi:DNA-binding NarL/FixJ family response regulator
MTIRVAVVDDHPLVIGGLDAALASVDDLEVVARGSTRAEAATLLARSDIDVVLLDVRLPDGNGLELLADAASAARPAVIVLSSFKNSQYVAAALRFGAQGFLLKTEPLEVLVDAIRRVAGGESAFSADQLRTGQTAFVRLTKREREIVRLVLDGRSNDEIGARIGASRKTVEAHLSTLYERYGVATRVELALRAERDGWLDIETNGG